MRTRLAPDAFDGQWEMATTAGDWKDDLRVRYRRDAPPPHLFAGLRVRDYEAARPWYERLLGHDPAFLPHATEAVWELAEHRYVRASDLDVAAPSFPLTLK